MNKKQELDAGSLLIKSYELGERKAWLEAELKFQKDLNLVICMSYLVIILIFLLNWLVSLL